MGHKFKWLAVVLVLGAPLSLMAQTCGGASTASGSGTASTTSTALSQGCDTTYRDSLIACDNKYGTMPPCPATPMPMKITGTKPQSFIKDFSPYLFAYARDPNDATRPYSGEWARGTVGDNTQTFQLVGNGTKNTGSGASSNRQNACVNQIDVSGMSAADQAKVVRLQIDNCTNQYILHTAIAPEYRKNPTLLSGQNPSDASERIGLDTFCQPLHTNYDGFAEYKPSDYIKFAWQKSLIDPTATKPHAPFVTSAGPVPSIMGILMQLVMSILSQLVANLGVGINVYTGQPHLATGVTLKYTTDPAIVQPATFPDVSLAQIATSQEGKGINYEMIVDPMHPFSPRWDYFYNDRDVSKTTGTYETDTTNSVYCAGNRGDSTKDTKDNKIYKVDVLEFRRPAFERGMMIPGRIGFNTACFKDPVAAPLVPLTAPIWPPNPAFALLVAGSYCYEITIPPAPPFEPGLATRLPCWKCFGHPINQKVDDKTTFPPCTTHYEGSDQNMSLFQDGTVVVPAALNAFSIKAHCMVSPTASSVSAAKLCQDLRRPLTGINVLKMRYHNPGATDTDKANDASYAKNDELPAGVPEGYTFNEYFKPSGENNGHMPYPRLWDTGRSIQKINSVEQDPMDVLGQYTTIVGVGREAVAQSQTSTTGNGASSSGGAGTGATSTTAPSGKDERCMYGGWGASTSFGGMSVTVPDSDSSWTELKLYQARTTREQNLVCIGRYEKVFKQRSTEGQLLLRASGEYTSTQMCSRDSSGKTTCRDYSDSQTAPTKDETVRTVHHSWPPGWRGYLSDPTTSQQFPAFGGSASTGLHTGLDDVQCGDLIMMPKGGGDSTQTGTGTGSASTLGLPKLARVIGLNTPNHASCTLKGTTDNTPSTCAANNNCFVDVEEADAGKWPDVCGTTEVAGGLQTRRFFKKGMFPQSGTNVLNSLNNWTHSCEDPGLNACELSTWDTLQYYRPSEDVRKATTSTGTTAP